MLKIGDKVLKINNKWLKGQEDPLNPLNLPPYTLRLKYTEGVTPTFSKGTAVQVSSSPNVWDLTYENSNWDSLVGDQSNQRGELLEVLGGNTSNVTAMNGLFGNCKKLTTVALFDTSKVTNTSWMFKWCDYLTSVPLFNTSKVTNMDGMFVGCQRLMIVPFFETHNVTSFYQTFADCNLLQYSPQFDTYSAISMYEMYRSCHSLRTIPLLYSKNVTNMHSMFYDCTIVESGLIAFYNYAMSFIDDKPDSEDEMFPGKIFDHAWTFRNCGSSSVTGAQELAQIPSDWK